MQGREDAGQRRHRSRVARQRRHAAVDGDRLVAPRSLKKRMPHSSARETAFAAMMIQYSSERRGPSACCVARRFSSDSRDATTLTEPGDSSRHCFGKTRRLRMFRFAIVAALALTPTLTPAVAPAALAADPASKQASAPVAPTATFVAQAAFGTMFEIESSKLALERSKAAAVKAFAQRMVDDHSAAAVKFKEAVLEAKLAMPPDKLDAKHQAVLERACRQAGRRLRQGLHRGPVQGARRDRRAVQGLCPGRRGYAHARLRRRAAAHAGAHLQHVAKMR